MPFKICLIGCGDIVISSHGCAMQRYAATHAEVELAACCDIDTARATAAQARFGFRNVYDDYRRMLSAEKPAAVFLAVPPQHTARIGTEVLGMGFPLLLEKPPGLTGEECRRLAQAAERHGTPAMVAFNRRYTPLLDRLRHELREAHPPQDIQLITYDLHRVNRNDADFSTTAIHGIDAVRFLAGSDYAEIRFRYQQMQSGVINAYLDAVMQSGAVARLSFCPTTGLSLEQASIHLPDHSYFVSLPVNSALDEPGHLLHFENSRIRPDTESAACGGGEAYESMGFLAEHTVFYDALRAGERPPADIATHLQSVEVAEAMRLRKAIYTAKP